MSKKFISTRENLTAQEKMTRLERLAFFSIFTLLFLCIVDASFKILGL